ncbi:arginase family protein [Nocardiopsis ganjiahuensis]|uniref:arginase family protein n=1 Tax=Nocardiopsis ganjiahuensis TaxID=239984 RepID=UPI001EF9F950|nr:arginase family protein [Nocardiopsis ganjiahuensis]
MTILCVPYHLDEYLPGFRFPLRVEPVTVRGNLPDANRWARMAALHEEVADRVADQVWAGRVPTVLSADCMVALGTTAGVQRAGVDPAVVWFDAHGDVQTMETSASGYEGGIPLRVLAGYRPDPATDRLGLRDIPEERLLLVDGRDLDPPEEEYLRASAVRRSKVADIGSGTLPDGPLLLHVDLDVIDAAEAPGLLFPTPGGPGAEEVLAAVRTVLDTGRVTALSIGCTWRPDEELDADDGPRARLVSALVAAPD